MRTRPSALAAALAVLTVTVGAWQSTLPKIGLSSGNIQTWATDSVMASTQTREGWPVPDISPAAAKAIQAMAPDERTALVREILSVVKAAVMAPAFRAAHTARIKETDHAIDHGIDPNSFNVADPAAEAKLIAIVGVLKMFEMQPAESIRQIFENDRSQLAETVKTETGEDRANAQKNLAALNALVPLSKSNLEEFKKAYILAKSASIGGPTTQAALDAAAAGTDQRQDLRDEQAKWNRLNLNAILKKTLTEFVDRASKVDFKIPTRVDGPDVVYTDPLRGEMGALSALGYRLGAAPTAAAIAFARAWLKEL